MPRTSAVSGGYVVRPGRFPECVGCIFFFFNVVWWTISCMWPLVLSAAPESSTATPPHPLPCSFSSVASGMRGQWSSDKGKRKKDTPIPASPCPPSPSPLFFFLLHMLRIPHSCTAGVGIRDDRYEFIGAFLGTDFEREEQPDSVD